MVAAGQGEPLRIGTETQLFMDDAVVAEMDGVFRLMNQPKKDPRNPVIPIDRPWEQLGGMSYGGDQGNIIYDAERGEYRFWSMQVNWDWSKDWLAYAVSDDGIHWRKPKLGVVEYRGHETNFVGKQGKWTQAGVLLDPSADPAHRYKMVYYGSEKEGHPPDLRGMCIAHSPDGIHWTPYPDKHQPIWPYLSDTSNNLLWDAAHDRYLYYLRLSTPLDRWFDPERVYPDDARTRTVGWASSENFVEWDAPRSKRDPEKAHVCFNTYRGDPDISRNFYTMSVLPYAGGYVGLAAVYHTTEAAGLRIPAGMDTGRARNRWLDKIDVQLLWSRDGKKFHRVSRRPFIPTGPEGAVDDDLIYPMQSILVRRKKGEIWIYYQGFGGKHSFYKRGEGQTGQVCLARLRLDGFVAVTGRGTLTTRPIVFEGDRLLINASGRDKYAGEGWGGVAVEVLDAETKEPLEGLDKEACETFTGDAVRHRVTWEGNGDLGEHAGRPVRLRFHIDRAKLFAFRLRETP